MSRPDKDQALAAFSRSMSLYFSGISVFIIFGVTDIVMRSIAGGTAAIICVIFLYRCIRFTRIRYVNILCGFLYFYKIEEMDSVKTEI